MQLADEWSKWRGILVDAVWKSRNLLIKGLENYLNCLLICRLVLRDNYYISHTLAGVFLHALPSVYFFFLQIQLSETQVQFYPFLIENSRSTLKFLGTFFLNVEI